MDIQSIAEMVGICLVMTKYKVNFQVCGEPESMHEFEVDSEICKVLIAIFPNAKIYKY